MSHFTISERPAHNALILDLNGDLIFGESTQSLRRLLRSLIAKGTKRIYLNLNGIVYLDSSGIGELISALIAINREEDGELKLLNPPEKVQQLLEISKLTGVFEIDYEDATSAGR